MMMSPDQLFARAATRLPALAWAGPILMLLPPFGFALAGRFLLGELLLEAVDALLSRNCLRLRLLDNDLAPGIGLGRRPDDNGRVVLVFFACHSLSPYQTRPGRLILARTAVSSMIRHSNFLICLVTGSRSVSSRAHPSLWR